MHVDIKGKILNLCDHYGITCGEPGWLDHLILSITQCRYTREFLENCLSTPQHMLHLFLDDEYTCTILAHMIKPCKYVYNDEYKVIKLHTGHISRLDYEWDVIPPFIVIEEPNNDHFIIDASTCEELYNTFITRYKESHVRYIEDEIPNHPLWLKIMRTRDVDARNTKSMIHTLMSTQYQYIKEFYDTKYGNAVIQIGSDYVSVIFKDGSYEFSTWDISSDSPTTNGYNLYWFSNDLWVYEGNTFLFALTPMEALKFFKAGSLAISVYDGLQSGNQLKEFIEGPFVESPKFTKYAEDVYMYNNGTWSRSLELPRKPYFEYKHNGYKTFVSHNKIIIQVKEENNGRRTT